MSHKMDILRSECLGELLRRRMRIDTSQVNGMIFKIADTPEEREAAYALFHDVYVLKGYMNPDASGERITPHHASPGATIFICRNLGRHKR